MIRDAPFPVRCADREPEEVFEGRCLADGSFDGKDVPRALARRGRLVVGDPADPKTDRPNGAPRRAGGTA